MTKVYIIFFFRRNINDKHTDEDYLEHCEYSHKGQRLCPIIRLKTIFDEISDTTFKETAIKGGIIGIKIKWDCNLDYDISECLPEYSFLRYERVTSNANYEDNCSVMTQQCNLLHC